MKHMNINENHIFCKAAGQMTNDSSCSRVHYFAEKASIQWEPNSTKNALCVCRAVIDILGEKQIAPLPPLAPALCIA